jgi:hypothetical protein
MKKQIHNDCDSNRSHHYPPFQRIATFSVASMTSKRIENETNSESERQHHDTSQIVWNDGNR